MFLNVFNLHPKNISRPRDPRNSLLSLDVPMRWHQAHPLRYWRMSKTHTMGMGKSGGMYDVGINDIWYQLISYLVVVILFLKTSYKIDCFEFFWSLQQTSPFIGIFSRLVSVIQTCVETFKRRESCKDLQKRTWQHNLSTWNIREV